MRPLLATQVEHFDWLKFPLLASPKLDGIRCLLMESIRIAGKRIAYSRTLKPIPNLHIRHTLVGSSLPVGIDGELIIGPTFQATASGVMSVAGEPDFKYHVFDYFGDGIQKPFVDRYGMLAEIARDGQYPWLKLVHHVQIDSLLQLEAYEQEQLALGHEGIMLRSLNGRYKYGRSTEREAILPKLKRFTESEARVTGFEELMHNDNAEERDNLGNMDRSQCQENLVPGDTLGALLVTDCKTHISFKIGTGFTAAQRKEIWTKREEWLNKIVTYKYQHIGIKVAPRCPVYLRERPDYKL